MKRARAQLAIVPLETPSGVRTARVNSSTPLTSTTISSGFEPAPKTGLS